MATLTGIGYMWALLSVTAATLCCSGFYLPFWIQYFNPAATSLFMKCSSAARLFQGRMLGRVDAYFNSFRRCNYPRLNPQGAVEIVMQCGRYSRWRDIPSTWWQVTTVLVGAGCVLSLLVAVMAVSSICVDYVIHSATVKLVGNLQLVAGLLVMGGLAVYPLGWNNREVRDCCGPASHVYTLGGCRLTWGLYLLVAATFVLFVCSSFTPSITRVNYHCHRL